MSAVVVLFLALLTKCGTADRHSSAPLRIVDLSHVFDKTTLNYPGIRPFKATSFLMEISGIRVRVDEYSSGTHVGTHMDAPCCLVPGGKSVTQIPLDRLIAPAAVIDIRHKAAYNRDYQVQIDDLLEWEHTTGVLLNDVILLVRSGWSRYWYSNATAYFGNDDNDPDDLHHPGISPAAAMWLVKNRNVYGTASETLNQDYGPARGFPVENILYRNNIYGLENVGDMSALPLFGATLHVLPMKIGGVCGAPTRIVATFPEKNRHWQ